MRRFTYVHCCSSQPMTYAIGFTSALTGVTISHTCASFRKFRYFPPFAPLYKANFALLSPITKEILPTMADDPVPLIWRWILFKEWLRRLRIRTRNHHGGPKRRDPQSDLYYDFRTTKPRPTQTAENAHPGVQYYA